MDAKYEQAKEEGKRSALAGEGVSSNPYLSDPDSGLHGSWMRGYRDHRTTDPSCPDCGGTGKLTYRSTGEPSRYDGVLIDCFCNKPLGE